MTCGRRRQQMPPLQVLEDLVWDAVRCKAGADAAAAAIDISGAGRCANHRRYCRVRNAVAICCRINAHSGDTFGSGLPPLLNRRNWNLTTAMFASEARVLFFHVIGGSWGALSLPRR